jgi:hypothetical protein
MKVSPIPAILPLRLLMGFDSNTTSYPTEEEQVETLLGSVLLLTIP